MAVYTEIGDEELAEFAGSYDIGDLMSCKGIAEGVENSNFLLSTSKGQFILTLYEKRVALDDLPFFLSLMHHLAENNVPCPVPVRDRQGVDLRELAGRPAAMVSFLEGMSVRRPRAEHCAALGRALGGMHMAAADFSMRRENGLSASGWGALFEKCRDHANDIEAGLEDEIETELDAIKADWPEDLPEGIIHADLFPDNVFFLGSKLSGLIDFYFACSDLLAYDIAICLNAWCFEPDASFNITKARAFLTGYQTQRKLENGEIDALPMLARGAALRFLLTRLYDWVNTPDGALVRPKNPLEYLKKLRFHKTVASAAGYGLDF